MGKLIWLTIFFSVLIWSAINPADRYTWWLEVAPALIALVILAYTYRRFPLTPLIYQLILVHCIILMIGGHYTYAEVPLFNWMQEWFDWSRNHYDKVGHFVQGFVPAMVARELFIRLEIVDPLKNAWRNFLIVSVCLAISAFYELIEWWVALLSEQAAESFLGTQGYVWDTQSDMFYALIGAIIALVLLGKPHDRQLQRLLKNDKE
ncbi:DUF2238 domain-containing protein [Thiomicrorhabdus sp. 6S3-12]|uniref:DUF2238 domain-containing protein n=1 Tax=Thiomicrorhabdus sp. 6S3-12 TaxID=2819681 RepID=UPI001AAD4139|nr:DUF2238 domain-containing protein [Thiomicrorhabdus sp. 6S3-12]MBO1924221.1 DUF2238 domain-containing protein [Thiomicrorhabdus sp. 6S3-12]